MVTIRVSIILTKIGRLLGRTLQRILAPIVLSLILLVLAVVRLLVLLLTVALSILIGLLISRGESLKQNEEFRFGDDSILLNIKRFHILSGLLLGKSPRLIELRVKLVQESMKFIYIEVAVVIRIEYIEDLVNEHTKNTIVET